MMEINVILLLDYYNYYNVYNVVLDILKEFFRVILFNFFRSCKREELLFFCIDEKIEILVG